jgi:hypothetical protein
MRTIALMHANQDHCGEGERFIRRALEITEKTLGSEQPEVAASLKVCTQVLRKAHGDTEARRAEVRPGIFEPGLRTATE